MSRTWFVAVIVLSGALGLYGNQLAGVLPPPYDRLLGPWVPVFGLAGVFAFAFIRARNGNRMLMEGSAQLTAGRVHAALELYAKARKLTPLACRLGDWARAEELVNNEAGPDGLRKVWPELADFAERSA